VALVTFAGEGIRRDRALRIYTAIVDVAITDAGHSVSGEAILATTKITSNCVIA